MRTGGARRIVVTGGPGAGKSTLIARLAALGLRTAEEAGRRVIREELASGGGALPWGDRLAFARRMLTLDIAAYEAAGLAGGLTIFDRGAPDVLGYLRLCALVPAPDLTVAADQRRYDDPVFLAPFWPEIFENDAERKQTPDEARRTADMMAEVYSSLGYRVVELPRAPINERVAFVLERCGFAAP